MSTLRNLTREEARRIAVRAQMLDAQRPPDLLSVAERLTALQSLLLETPLAARV